MALGSRALSGARAGRPPPRPGDLLRLHGTVPRMRLYTEGGSRLHLFLRMDTERGPAFSVIAAWLWKEFRRWKGGEGERTGFQAP